MAKPAKTLDRLPLIRHAGGQQVRELSIGDHTPVFRKLCFVAEDVTSR
jgi:hypothetical protein